MVTDTLQKAIHDGDRNAFKQLYDEYAKEVYLRANESLQQDTEAREVVKQTFARLYQQLRSSDGPIQIETRIRQLSDSEIYVRKLAADICDVSSTPSASSKVWNDAPVSAAAASIPVAVSPVSVSVPTAPAADLPHPSVMQPVEAEPIPPQQQVEDEAHLQIPQPAPLPDQESARPLRPVLSAKADMPPVPPHRHRSNAAVTVLIVLLFALLVWIITGILMDMGVLPFFDLGFVWFNQHIYPLFALQAVA